MTKRYFCKVCGKYSGKSQTCKQCKKDIPYSPAGKDSVPFNRKNLWGKKK